MSFGWTKSQVLHTVSEMITIMQSLREPRQQRLLRRSRAPWILEHCPESLRKFVIIAYLVFGLLSLLVFTAAVLGGFICLPHLLAHSQSDVPIALWMRAYLHWVETHFSKANFGAACCTIQCSIAWITFYFISAVPRILKKLSIENRLHLQRSVPTVP